MAFVNENLTKEEREELRARAIKNPGNPFMTLDSSNRTIDREKNIYLIWAMKEREEPHDVHFVLFWKDTPITVKLRNNWRENSTRYWEMLRIEIQSDLKQDHSEIIQDLKDALTVYGYNGSPNDPFDAMNKDTKVLFNF